MHTINMERQEASVTLWFAEHFQGSIFAFSAILAPTTVRDGVQV